MVSFNLSQSLLVAPARKNQPKKSKAAHVALFGARPPGDILPATHSEGHCAAALPADEAIRRLAKAAHFKTRLVALASRWRLVFRSASLILWLQMIWDIGASNVDTTASGIPQVELYRSGAHTPCESACRVRSPFWEGLLQEPGRSVYNAWLLLCRGSGET